MEGLGLNFYIWTFGTFEIKTNNVRITSKNKIKTKKAKKQKNKKTKKTKKTTKKLGSYEQIFFK